MKWPAGWPRTPAHQRRRGNFTYQGDEAYTTREPTGPVTRYRKVTRPLTRAKATQRVTDEIERMGGGGTKIETFEVLRRDGTPRADSQQPLERDPGVIVSFRLGNRPIAMPCDSYASIEQNLAAIAATLEAKRAIERHGVSTREREFEGYAALPAGGEPPALAKDPRFIEASRALEVAASVGPDTFNDVRRSILKRYHPDNAETGDAEIFKALQSIIEAQQLVVDPV